jgi:hypothetical protein
VISRAGVLCKRAASITKLAKAEIAEIQKRQAEMSERLITNYRATRSSATTPPSKRRSQVQLAARQLVIVQR